MKTALRGKTRSDARLQCVQVVQRGWVFNRLLQQRETVRSLQGWGGSTPQSAGRGARQSARQVTADVVGKLMRKTESLICFGCAKMEQNIEPL